MSVELLKEIKESLSLFGSNFKALSDKMEGQFAVYENRFSKLERMYEDRLIKQHGHNDVPKKSWSWFRYITAFARKDWSLAPFEKEECDKHRDLVTKTMQASNFGTGGSWIPPQYVAELIEALRPLLIMERLGATMLTGLVGSPVVFPKQTDILTASWLAPEGATIPAQDVKTGQLNLTPHKCAKLVKISNDLTLLGNPSIEAAVRAELTNAIARAVDQAAIRGTGAAGEPLGVFNWTPAVPSDAGPLDFTDAGTVIADLTSIIKTVEKNNALTDNAKFACNPNVYWKLASTVDADKRPILQASAQSGISGAMPPNVLGYPVIRSTLVADEGTAAGTDMLFFGNWADLVVAVWSQVDIASTDQSDSAFQNDEIWVRAIARVDIGLRHANSFFVFDRADGN